MTKDNKMLPKNMPIIIPNRGEQTNRTKLISHCRSYSVMVHQHDLGGDSLAQIANHH